MNWSIWQKRSDYTIKRYDKETQQFQYQIHICWFVSWKKFFLSFFQKCNSDYVSVENMNCKAFISGEQNLFGAFLEKVFKSVCLSPNLFYSCVISKGKTAWGSSATSSHLQRCAIITQEDFKRLHLNAPYVTTVLSSCYRFWFSPHCFFWGGFFNPTIPRLEEV